MIKKK
jgi:hypothetical protein